ncbi:MAG: hypothetical protein AB7L09_01840 [Nitrospira sp.]
MGMDYCDLCGKRTRALSTMTSPWGEEEMRVCADPIACASTWSEGFEQDPAETAILSVSAVFPSMEEKRPATETQRLARL